MPETFIDSRVVRTQPQPEHQLYPSKAIRIVTWGAVTLALAGLGNRIAHYDNHQTQKEAISDANAMSACLEALGGGTGVVHVDINELSPSAIDNCDLTGVIVDVNGVGSSPYPAYATPESFTINMDQLRFERDNKAMSATKQDHTAEFASTTAGLVAGFILGGLGLGKLFSNMDKAKRRAAASKV